MRKTTIALACAALLLLPGASVWEGSAIVAGSGELPESGYYIATNSFPRNTIVDVKNLETDKTVRAIVAGSLDSPGLLASLSPEAAASIGLARRTVGRIRITVPADPIAFSRFTDGLAASADPDRNPRAAVAATAIPVTPVPAPGSTPMPSGASESISAASGSEKPVEAAPETVAEEAPPVPSSEPAAPVPAGPIVKAEAAKAPEEAPAEEQIIDVPDNYVPPAPAPTSPVVAAVSVEAGVQEEPPVPEDAEPAELAEPEAPVEESPQATTAPEAPVAEEPIVTVIAEPETPEVPTESVQAVPPADAPPTAPPAVATVPDEPELKLEPEPETTTAPEPIPQPLGEVVLELQPAEARPPSVPEPSLDTEAFVEPAAPTVETVVEEPAAAALSPNLFVPPLPPLAPPAAPTTVTETSVPAPALAAAPPPPETPKIETETTAVPPAVAAPVLENLEKDKYYVQLGAYADTSTVNEIVANIGKQFPAAVETGKMAEKPVYRVYIGPVNQGESGALLLRFKRGGYPDAFVKKGK